MKGKAFTILKIQGRLSNFFLIMAAKTLKNLYCFETVMFKIFLKGKKAKIQKEKP